MALSTLENARRVLSLIDLTNLNDGCAPTDITALCAQAVGMTDGELSGRGATAAVCIWSPFVAQARQELTGSDVHIATVVNFPKGGTDTETVVAETKSALADGADEIDLVFPYEAFKAGDLETAREQVAAVRAVVPSGAWLKVILETGELVDPALIKSASEMCIAEGAHFIKTSTGKVEVNATLEAAEIMLTAIKDSGKAVGFKPAGGIRTYQEAADYLALSDRILGPDWVSPETFRFGASSLLGNIEAILQGGSAEGQSTEGY